ncbi:MAG: hypothetical protein KA740_08830 [Rhodoferax sp.]|nr:hypothetical protein [Rhodoferax sp.]
MTPLWQLAQLVVATTLAWKLAGFQLVKPLLWQAMQFNVDATWVAFLPVALLPLWQLAQLVAAVNVLWSIPRAGNQAEVL